VGYSTTGRKWIRERGLKFNLSDTCIAAEPQFPEKTGELIVTIDIETKLPDLEATKR
jgi:hypothetical protein